jgi:pSer/pThr/pTyr-binding forkhead associated (FHA) protein
MPLIRCPKCGQAYDIPGVVAVRLHQSIATCSCGEWLSGSKAALLARTIDPKDIKQIDLKQYRVDTPFEDISGPDDAAPIVTKARSVRVVAKGANESVNTIFTIAEHPLWIGRKGCHVELAEAELSIRHCSISVHGEQLVVRDADSHMGTFLDGQPVERETALPDGVHILRVGSALVSVEPTNEKGTAVEPIALEADDVMDESQLARKARERIATQPGQRYILVCVDGPLRGQEFEVPVTGLVIGREGHVRVPDEFLSRRHFEILRDSDGSARVRDLGSRNGTFLNTLPARNTRIHNGDEIRAGVNRFRIEQRV